ncbi:urease accessory protein UreF [Rhizobium sp. KVB221]|uniref:Urease accessory protein UreF n=1 Tax=Rhizobium setariae TaxID=2801340 RepID=A0A936YT47_9HYPH|nr:urease accessory protein UreF [Rhizobium setariae]MBL0372481.1 urease accessory protein UreF [Rhizobium setariae]
MVRMTTTITTIDSERSLIRLMTWLSPAFPVGGFAYSGGLESAVHDGMIANGDELARWLQTQATNGVLWNDAVLQAEAWRSHADCPRLQAASELAEALAGSAERHLELMALGEAFVAAASAWPHPVLAFLGGRPPYAIAVGAVAAGHGISLDSTTAAYLHAVLSQAVSAAIRLGVIGQKQGVSILAGLEADIVETARRSTQSTLDDLGAATFIADLAAIRHETQYTRLFRS